MKTLRLAIRRILLENEEHYEKLGKLMSSPLKNPDGWLQGFQLGMDAGYIKVLKKSEDGDVWFHRFSKYTEWYEVDIPWAISKHFYSEINQVNEYTELPFVFEKVVGGLIVMMREPK